MPASLALSLTMSDWGTGALVHYEQTVWEGSRSAGALVHYEQTVWEGCRTTGAPVHYEQTVREESRGCTGTL